MFARVAAVVTAMSLVAGAVYAAPITRTFDFTGTGLYGPITTFTGSATVTFDTLAYVEGVTTGVTLHNATVVPATPFSYTYYPAIDTLYLSGASGGGGLFLNTTDFFVGIQDPRGTNPVMVWLTYSLENGAFGDTHTGTVTAYDGSPPTDPGAVPEPATWALLLLGFYGLGAALRRARPAVV